MYWLSFIILMVTGLLSVKSFAQSRHSKSVEDFIAHDKKFIIGTWEADDDSNNINIYTKDSCYELYGKDTTGISYYIIADSCQMSYEGGGSSQVPTFLKEHYHFYPYRQGDHIFLECFPIMGLNDSVLVLMYFDGSIGHFHRIR